MEFEKPDRDEVGSRQESIRPLRRGIIVYLMASTLIAFTCYLFGWRTIGSVGTGYL